MKKPLFTALSPNAQADDIWLAYKLLFMPWKWRKGSALEKLREFFIGWFDASYVFFFESGRTCLYALLFALNLQKDDEVLLQSYTCVAVPEPILWVGAKPIYVDCEEQTFTMSAHDLEKKITARSKVLILQHTFGQPADIEKLKEIAQKHHLFVIEDCAHALGSLYKGKNVGGFGDASFFSFGRDKVISSVFGGALVVKDQVLARKIEDFQKSCGMPSRGWIFQQLLHPVITGLAKATYRIFLGKIILQIAKRLHLISKAVYKAEKDGDKPPFFGKKFPNALACLALHQIQKLDVLNKHRRELAQFYEKSLKNLPLTLPQSLENTEPIYLRYTIRADKPKSLLQAAHRQQINLGDWYITALAPEGVNYKKLRYNPLECPVAEKLALETVNLPTDIHISKADAERIISFLKKFYGSPD